MLKRIFDFISNHVFSLSILALFILIVLCFVIFRCVISYRHKDFIQHYNMKKTSAEIDTSKIEAEVGHRTIIEFKTSNKELINLIHISKNNESDTKK